MKQRRWLLPLLLLGGAFALTRGGKKDSSDEGAGYPGGTGRGDTGRGDTGRGDTGRGDTGRGGAGTGEIRPTTTVSASRPSNDLRNQADPRGLYGQVK